MTVLDPLVAGLTAPVTDDEREAARRPPYPVPAARIAPMNEVLGVLRARVPEDGGPRTVTRSKGRPTAYRDVVAALERPGRFDFADAACALLAVGELTDADVEALAESLPAHCGIRRQQVLNRLADGEIDGAHTVAETIGDGLAWVGHRDVGGVLADRGDADAFFAGWKRYAATQDRHGMAELKRRLVVGVAGARGWQEALAVTEDKRIGPDLARYAFESYPVDDLDGLSAAVANVLSEQDALSVLARAVRLASGRNPERDHPHLGGIVDRIIAVDPADKATMRWRDGELFGLWPAYGEQATLDRARAAVRTPNYRRELRVLARDL